MFKRIRQFFGKLSWRAITPDWIYRMPMPHILFPVKSGAVVNEDTAISWSAFWRGLQIAGCAIGSMPFTIIEEDADGNIETRRNHPLWSIVNVQPHPFYSTFDFLQGVMYQALLRGNAVIVINRIGRNLGSNRPGSLRLVHWDDVTEVRETEGGLLVYDILGFPSPIPSSDIIHIKGLTKTGICGLDTLNWNRETFGLALSSREAAANYHRNGTRSDGFLTTEQNVDTERRKIIQKAWNAQTRSGETPFLTGGIKWEKIGLTPKDVELLESRQFDVYEAARLLGISPHLLFAMDRANFSNVETLSLEFAKYTLRFWVERIEQEFNRKLFRGSETGRVKVNLNMDAFLRGDTETRAKYLQMLIDRGVFSIDEARKLEGFNMLKDDAGKVHIVPLNFQTLDQMIENGGQADGSAAQDGEPVPQGREKMNGHAKNIMN